MNILYCKNLWWPFGSHLIHVMHRKRYADMHGYKLLYNQNNHPAYSLYGGQLSELFASISDIEDSEIIDYSNKNYTQASHNDHFLLKYSENKQLIESFPIGYNTHINTAKWHKFKPECFDTIEGYQASVMKKIAEPSSKVKEYLNNLSFIREVSELNGFYIAVHIRWTDKVSGWCAEADFYDVDVYFKHALNLREKYETNNIVLNCDNKDALEKFINYNSANRLNFNIFYDRQEILPIDDWRECVCQKFFAGTIADSDVLVKDLLNGFKIYKTIFEADSVVCDYFSNMALAPCLARNSGKDINISNKAPYAIFPGEYWPRDMFSESVKKKRREGKLVAKLGRRNE